MGNSFRILFLITLLINVKGICSAGAPVSAAGHCNDTAFVKALPDPDENGAVIEGQVLTSDHKPAPYVTVIVLGSSKNATTDETGHFAIRRLQPGTYTIEVSLSGYQTIQQQITIEGTNTITLNLELQVSRKQLSEIVLTAERPSNMRISSLGKAGIAARDLPQSVTVVDQQVLQRQQVQNLGDVLKNISGVYVMGTTGGVQQEIGGRGYLFNSTNTFKNGMQYNNKVMPEMSSAQSVEFLKGSAAILMGNVTAGGVLNIVTKKPSFDKGGEVSMRAGSFGFYKPSLDIYGPLGDSKSVAYRINTTYEKDRSFRDSVHAERYYVNPSFLIKAGAKTTVLVEGDYLTDSRTYDVGVGAINYVINPIPRNRFIGVGWSYNKVQQGNVTATTTHNFNDNWQLRNLTGFYNYTSDMFGNVTPDQGGTGGIEANGTWVRGIQRTGINEHFYQTQFDLVGKFSTGFAKHQLLVGAVLNQDQTNTLAYGTLKVYDSVNVFDLSKYPARTDIPALAKSTLTSAPVNSFGAYVQDLVSLTSQLKLLAGVRYNYEQTISHVYTYPAYTEKTTSTDAHPFTPRLGIVYQPTRMISVFASYANSFTLNTGVDTAGNALPPSFINQYEAGIKTDWFHRLVSVNVTAYRIVNSNLAQQSLANGNTNSNIKELAGQVTAKGVEVELTTQSISGFTFAGGYSYNDTRYTKSNTYQNGSPLMYVPTHMANGSVFYAFAPNTHLKGLSLGLVGQYMRGMEAGRLTRVTVQNDTRQLMPVPAFTQVDAAAAFAFNRVRIEMKLSNIFNVLGYYAHEDESINPIAPRQVSASLAWKL